MPTALVTGAGIRVGRAIALRLAGAGFDLILHANRSREQLEVVAQECRDQGRTVTVIGGDLGDRAARQIWIEQVREHAQTLDVLVNNAAIYESLEFTDVSFDAWDRMLGLNLEAPFFITQGLLPLLKAAEKASVINITDSGLDWPDTKYAHYFASKSGLDMLTRVLALELAPDIRVNSVAPGTVAFPPNFSPESKDAILKNIPMGRVGSPDDIAKAVCYLVEQGSYVTGQSLAVDGGRNTQ
jgi:pteridine reductase